MDAGGPDGRAGAPIARAPRRLLLATLLLAFILVPFALFEDAIRARTDAFLAAAPANRAVAGAGIALLLAADVVLPVPSSIVSTAAGALLGFAAGAAASWAGMGLGCAAAYAIGRRAGREGARRLLEADDLAAVERAAERFGAAAIVILRPVPVLAEASVLLAGIARMSFSRFAVAAALANLGVAVAYAAVGAFAAGVDSFLAAFAGAVLIPGAALLVARVFRR